MSAGKGGQWASRFAFLRIDRPEVFMQMAENDSEASQLGVCWKVLGANRKGVSKRISAGVVHGLALRADGTVTAWGAGRYRGDAPGCGQPIVPAGLRNLPGHINRIT